MLIAVPSEITDLCADKPIQASLCGHFELVQLLLESGALAERDTFQGERCIYNALNDRIRNLLLQYDYSKSTDPLQPWAAHITSLLAQSTPQTSDITVAAAESFQLHKFLLSARTPYFRQKLTEAPETTSWKLPSSVPVESFQIVIRYMYLGDLPRDLVGPWSSVTEEEILTGIDKISKQLEVNHVWETILSGNDRRLARQRHQDEVSRAADQVGEFFQEKILGHKMIVDPAKVEDVKWRHDNSIFADCLLRADEAESDTTAAAEQQHGQVNGNAIPIGPGAASQTQNGESRRPKSVLYPVHKAMLIRSPYFEKMFSSGFKEGLESEHLHVVKVDCVPEVLEIILAFLYTEKADCPLELGLDLLYAADMLFLDKLKTKAAIAISTLGSGNNNILVDRTHAQEEEGAAEVEIEPINVYDVIHAAWDLRVQRLEEFAARYIAYRLEDYIDEEEFAELIQESASRLQKREETDTIELLDDIRYYLSDRFRLRFEDAGLEEMLDEEGEIDPAMAEALAASAEAADGKEAPAAQGAAEVTPTTQNTTQEGKAPEPTNGINGVVRTLDGEVVDDEFSLDAMNYQILLQKIDTMLEKLKLDA